MPHYHNIKHATKLNQSIDCATIDPILGRIIDIQLTLISRYPLVGQYTDILMKTKTYTETYRDLNTLSIQRTMGAVLFIILTMVICLGKLMSWMDWIHYDYYISIYVGSILGYLTIKPYCLDGLMDYYRLTSGRMQIVKDIILDVVSMVTFIGILC